MKVMEVLGGKDLSGTIRISGAKNATVALIPAAILTDEEVTICNVPEITDTDALCDILKSLNVDVKRASESVVINPKDMKNIEIAEEYSKKLRASYYFMGALLGKYKKASMYFPGGCSIGARPIRAKGKTVIDNAAKEPEIVNVATFLNNMGAKISGAGTSTIKIEGVDYLHQCFHEVIPDRIEAGTYIIIGALCGSPLKVDNLIPDHLDALLSKLEEIGVDLEIGADYVIINKKDVYKSTTIKTAVYPGFPTDLQQPFTVLQTQCNGKSKTVETIWENRFMHIPYLNKLGADITIKNQTATVMGPTKLKGSEVVATDLRAGAAMVAAALKADGKTTITNVEHILRGYESIIEKLTSVGAKITLKDV